MTPVWDRLEGVSLAGEYGLQQWLGGDSSGAFFLTTFGPERQPAVLRLIPEGSFAAEAQLALWRRTARLAHPSLLALLDCGRTSAGGDVFLYAVFENPDDSLAVALQNGPFNEDEARDVLVAALDALRYIHGEGLVHGSIDAEHIVAVGDRIKVASDTLRDARDSETTYSDDIRALGALIDKLVSGVSEPLRAMIQRALEDASALTAAKVAPAVDNGAKLQAPGPFVRGDVAASRVAAAVSQPAPRNLPRIARYVPLLAVVALALLAAVFVIANRSNPAPAQPSAAVGQPSAVAQPPVSVSRPATAQPVAVPPPRVASPPPRVASPPATAPKAAVKPPAPDPSPRSPYQTWRVIAYTYTHYNDAEKKAQSINTRFPGFHAEVFTLKRSPVPYLISLGAHLTREEAAALQKRAIARGLPGDTFIRNFAD